MTPRHVRPTEKPRVTAGINLRAELRLVFPKNAFRVSSLGSGTDTELTIEWFEGPETHAVYAIASKYTSDRGNPEYGVVARITTKRNVRKRARVTLKELARAEP